MLRSRLTGEWLGGNVRGRPGVRPPTGVRDDIPSGRTDWLCPQAAHRNRKARAEVTTHEGGSNS
jgi:hypothetical protein